jgi:hypothetical protein
VSGGNGGLVTGGVGGWTMPKVDEEATDDNNYSESKSAGEPVRAARVAQPIPFFRSCKKLVIAPLQTTHMF